MILVGSHKELRKIFKKRFFQNSSSIIKNYLPPAKTLTLLQEKNYQLKKSYLTRKMFKIKMKTLK
jgi:hypothetical protein